MRYLVGFVFLALVAVPLVGCSETTGDGGMGGGGTGGMPECETAEDCDDENECTGDACNAANSSCENTPVRDGSSCAAGRGGCYGGLCNFVPVRVAVGAKEVVFDWTTDRCDDSDVPDSPPDAVRAANGEIVLFNSNAPTNYVSRGADFNTLEHVCDPPALVSAGLPTPESYENQEWLWSPYREGENWHVLIHNEFHDAEAPTCNPGDPTSGNPCWYNSITYAVSTDDARSFVKPGAPAHVVAPAPSAWSAPLPGTPPGFDGNYLEGYLQPSSIVRGPDDYYYVMVLAHPSYRVNYGGACVMRTRTLNDPASWRAWDGNGFDLALTSPYVTGSQSSVCYFVANQLTDNLTYNTYLDRYMLLSTAIIDADGQQECGILLSLSLDLIHWSEAQLLAPAQLVWCEMDPQTPGLLDPEIIAYPTIIDHEDSTINFERPGRTAYLYYTRFNGGIGPDRDLVRVPVTFTLED
jgi:hypothetical protein